MYAIDTNAPGQLANLLPWVIWVSRGSQMKVYKLYLAKPLLLFCLFMLGVWIFGSLVGIIVAVLGKFGPDGPPAWVFLIVLGFALFNSYMWLRFPFEIKVCDDSTIEFRSIFRRTSVSPMTVKSVRAKSYALGFVDVAHQGGTVHLLNQMDGFHDFIATLKSMNPSVKIQGC
jgi:hypothetical protein